MTRYFWICNEWEVYMYWLFPYFFIIARVEWPVYDMRKPGIHKLFMG